MTNPMFSNSIMTFIPQILLHGNLVAYKWALFSRLRVQPSEPTLRTKCNTMVRVGRMAYCLNVNDKLVVPSNEQQFVRCVRCWLVAWQKCQIESIKFHFPNDNTSLQAHPRVTVSPKILAYRPTLESQFDIKHQPIGLSQNHYMT